MRRAVRDRPPSDLRGRQREVHRRELPRGDWLVLGVWRRQHRIRRRELYHTFDAPGSYDVTLTISNEGGETSDTFEDAVVVLDAGDMDLPMAQGFRGEFLGRLVHRGRVEDGTWEVTTDASASGSRCMTIELDQQR